MCYGEVLWRVFRVWCDPPAGDSGDEEGHVQHRPLYIHRVIDLHIRRTMATLGLNFRVWA